MPNYGNCACAMAQISNVSVARAGTWQNDSKLSMQCSIIAN